MSLVSGEAVVVPHVASTDLLVNLQLHDPTEPAKQTVELAAVPYPLVKIEDVATLEAVCSDPRSPFLVQSVATLSVRDAGTRLGAMHPYMAHMTNLRKLDLSGSAVHYLPYFVSSLTSLHELSMARCALNFVPSELAALSHNLTSLDLSRNQLLRAPDALCALTGLKTLNLMGNPGLRELPASIGALTQLRLLGLKSCGLTALPQSFTQLRGLVELFLTDNQLTTLPKGFGALTSLVKLQASFNRFTHLPPDVWQLPNLELFRVAVCQLETPPGRLHEAPTPPPGAGTAPMLPRLAWCSLGGNPACAPLPAPRPNLRTFTHSELSVTDTSLGAGASGEVSLATDCASGETLAVKTFTADVSPDGRTEEELAISCALSHPNIAPVVGLLPRPAGAAPGPPQMVMRLVPGQPLAAKPTSQHLLRCKWAPGVQFTLAQCQSIASGLASALAAMHDTHHVCHGDVYAHNVLYCWDTNTATLCDFGAAFVYAPHEGFWQSMEVRAFGLLLHDLVSRLVPNTPGAAVQALQDLVTTCTQPVPADRPRFAQLVQQLTGLPQA